MFPTSFCLSFFSSLLRSSFPSLFLSFLPFLTLFPPFFHTSYIFHFFPALFFLLFLRSLPLFSCPPFFLFSFLSFLLSMSFFPSSCSSCFFCRPTLFAIQSLFLSSFTSFFLCCLSFIFPSTFPSFSFFFSSSLPSFYPFFLFSFSHLSFLLPVVVLSFPFPSSFISSFTSFSAF